jgi:hypothetical protein
MGAPAALYSVTVPTALTSGSKVGVEPAAPADTVVVTAPTTVSSRAEATATAVVRVVLT